MSIEQAELVTRLRALAKEMQALSEEMIYYGGFAELAQHGRELENASWIVLGWAGGIEDEG